MASIAEDYGMKGKAAKAPISTHPAFPFIVALWFAALLGMGSLVVPVELIEQIAVSTGLASVVPATAPPLGFTARALIALAFTAAGALTGLLIARQIAKAHAPEVSRRYPHTMQHQPIQAHAELGAHGLDGNRPAIQPKGRRSLAIELDHGPSELLDFAPLPGKRIDAGNSALEMLDLDAREFVPATWTPDAAEADPFADDELELTEDDLMPGNAFERAAPAAEALPGFQTFADDGADDSADRGVHDMMGERPPFGMPQGSGRPSSSSARQLFRATPAPVVTPTWSDDEPAQAAETVPTDEPLSFSPPSLTRFDAPAAIADEAPFARGPEVSRPEASNIEVEDAEPMFENHAQFAQPTGHDGAAASPAGADLEDLGLVQLAQRLGNSIERRRENLAARAQQAAVIPAPPLSEDIDVAAPDEAAEAMAAYFARPAVEPAVDQQAAQAEAQPVAYQPPVAERQMFQPVADDTAAKQPVAYGALPGLGQIGMADDDDDEINDLAASFSLPLGRQAAPALFAMPEAFGAPQPAIAAEESDEETEVEPDFASLLALRNPFQEPRAETFVRIEDEPEVADDIGQTAVVFPAELAPKAAPSPIAFASQPSAPVNNEENERALREALLSLQRMSGAA